MQELDDDDGENFLHYCAQNMALHIIEHIIDKFRKSRHPFDDIRLLASAKNSSQLNVLDIFKIQAKLKVLNDQDRERLNAIEQLLFGQKNDHEADQHQALLFRQRALDKAPIQLEKIAGKKIDKL